MLYFFITLQYVCIFLINNERRKNLLSLSNRKLSIDLSSIMRHFIALVKILDFQLTIKKWKVKIYIYCKVKFSARFLVRQILIQAVITVKQYAISNNYYLLLFIYCIQSIRYYNISVLRTILIYHQKKQNNGKSSICLKDLAKNKRTADGADRDIPKQ